MKLQSTKPSIGKKEPVYGTPSASSKYCNVPSSPMPPCTVINQRKHLNVNLSCMQVDQILLVINLSQIPTSQYPNINEDKKRKTQNQQPQIDKSTTSIN